jgi:Kinesin motor domain
MHDVLLETNKSVGLLEKTISLRLTANMPINKIPCRQSKLVYALKDILTDQRAKITIVACISSERLKLEETVCCLGDC